jgi:rhamnulose-1-phosphate aldolase
MQLSKTNDQARKAAAKIADIAGILWEKGWAEGSAGNISVNVTEQYPGIHLDFRTFPMIALKTEYPSLAGNFIFITTKGSRMRQLATEPGKFICLIKISQAGDAYQLLFEDPENPNDPSSELLSHLAIHNYLVEERPDFRAIVHCHPDELIILSHHTDFKDESTLNEAILGLHTETGFFIPKGMGLVPLNEPGSQDLASATLEKLQEHQVVLWKNHGSMAIGKDVNEAFDMIDLMNKAARIYLATSG